MIGVHRADVTDPDQQELIMSVPTTRTTRTTRTARAALGALAVAGLVTLAGAGAASAQGTDPVPPSTTAPPHLTCAELREKATAVDTRLGEIRDRVAKAKVTRDELAAAGRTRLADTLTRRIDRAEARLAEVTPKVERALERIDSRCPAPNPAG